MPFAYRLGWHFFRSVFATYFRWKVFHPERVPLEGPVVLAPNHQSFLDPPLVGSPVRRMVSFLARETLFHSALLGPILRSWQVIALDREGGTGSGLKAIIDRLKSGGAVLLFPEGTRSRDGQLQKGRSGIGLVVIKSGAAVVPVRIFGTFEAFGRQARFPRPRRVALKYGLPLRFEALHAEARACSKPRLKEIYQQVADEIMAAIAALEPRSDAPG
jgi:1-acyl-sn-glycerol-3-phosphate acyltransferase